MGHRLVLARNRLTAHWTAGLLAVFVALCLISPALAIDYKDAPMLNAKSDAGELPPVGERLPENPMVLNMAAVGKSVGQYSDELKTLIGRARDIRLLVVYGYARLIGYDEDLNMFPDILESFDVQEGRIFTFKIRKGHRWSDGAPFTSNDFAYYWNDVANFKKLSPSGPPIDMIVDGEAPKFEVLDQYTVRYTWKKQNHNFLPRLAGASPLFIYRPAHYLEKFHARYADPDSLKKLLREHRTRNWASLHNRLDNMYRFNNPELPTLQPWRNTTRAPATRFIGERNAYFHRVDETGQQLPYFDRVVLAVSDAKLIPAKAGTGEVDLQSRNVAFNNYTFLKEHQKEGEFQTFLWNIAKGSHMALFPNMNVKDEAWRKLMRDVRFRRALSLSIDRTLINETLYFGLAIEGNNTLLPSSPLFNEDNQKVWTDYDTDHANEILDELGLDKFNDDDIRLLPDGRPMEIIVETAGEETEQVDVLQLIAENWAEIGIKMYIKPSQREIFRNRVFSGDTQVSVWFGLENGIATAAMTPGELAPTSQQQLQWPKWGEYYETSHRGGEAPDMDIPIKLLGLLEKWQNDTDTAARTAVWQEMLKIYADQMYSIGIVSGVKQPIVVKNGIMNVPQEAIYNWDPGAQFGIYRPDSFWRKTDN
jgi:peptide/nickel transport system substrate-binding protein